MELERIDREDTETASFSADVKRELSKDLPRAMHCLETELSAFVAFSSRKSLDPGKNVMVLQTDSNSAALVLSKLLFKVLRQTPQVMLRHKKNGQETFFLSVNGEKYINRLKEKTSSPDLHRGCCKKAFLRGAFLAAGAISDPEHFYHLEISSPDIFPAESLLEIFSDLSLKARSLERKGQQVIYIKDAESISQALAAMGATNALMDFENIRILRGMRGSVNRRVNCETANINKTVAAAVSQLADIEYIRGHVGFDSLKEPYKETAILRLEYPDASLSELAEKFSEPVGRSGVNHRLKKLSKIAEELRRKE